MYCVFWFAVPGKLLAPWPFTKFRTPWTNLKFINFCNKNLSSVKLLWQIKRQAQQGRQKNGKIMILLLATISGTSGTIANILTIVLSHFPPHQQASHCHQTVCAVSLLHIQDPLTVTSPSSMNFPKSSCSVDMHGWHGMNRRQSHFSREAS